MTTSKSYRRSNWRNSIQSAGLIGAMLLLIVTVGYALQGMSWVLMIPAFSIMTAMLVPNFGPALFFRFQKAKAVTHESNPELYQRLDELSQRAGLSRVPRLYCLPNNNHNAFAVGSGRAASIGVTQGILQDFPEREVAGILAHEMSHISSRDTLVMGLMDTIRRSAKWLSRLGMLLLLLNLPLMILGQSNLSMLAILIMLASPTLATLIQLGLSRTREFAADASAAELTGDPDGLAMALNRLEEIQRRASKGWLSILFPVRQPSDKRSLTRTHPPTKDRIERLLLLKPTNQSQPSPS